MSKNSATKLDFDAIERQDTETLLKKKVKTARITNASKTVIDMLGIGGSIVSQNYGGVARNAKDLAHDVHDAISPDKQSIRDQSHVLSPERVQSIDTTKLYDNLKQQFKDTLQPETMHKLSKKLNARKLTYSGMEKSLIRQGPEGNLLDKVRITTKADSIDKTVIATAMSIVQDLSKELTKEKMAKIDAKKIAKTMKNSLSKQEGHSLPSPSKKQSLTQRGI